MPLLMLHFMPQLDFSEIGPRLETTLIKIVDSDMATWKCTSCGTVKEGRCKPKKCPKCGGQDTFKKKE